MLALGRLMEDLGRLVVGRGRGEITGREVEFGADGSEVQQECWVCIHAQFPKLLRHTAPGSHHAKRGKGVEVMDSNAGGDSKRQRTRQCKSGWSGSC